MTSLESDTPAAILKLKQIKYENSLDIDAALDEAMTKEEREINSKPRVSGPAGKPPINRSPCTSPLQTTSPPTRNKSAVSVVPVGMPPLAPRSSSESNREDNPDRKFYLWQADNGKWHEYSKENCAIIHAGFQKWRAEGCQLFVSQSVDITVDDTLFEVEFVSMTQINDHSGKFRKIRNKGDVGRLCRHGDKCTFIDCHFVHPNEKERRVSKLDTRSSQLCRFGEFCSRANCVFLHPSALRELQESFPELCKHDESCWEPNCRDAHTNARERKVLKRYRQRCRNGDACTRLSCRKTHPNAGRRKGVRCGYGDMCRVPACKFSHIGGSKRVGLQNPNSSRTTPRTSAGRFPTRTSKSKIRRSFHTV